MKNFKLCNLHSHKTTLLFKIISSLLISAKPAVSSPQNFQFIEIIFVCVVKLMCTKINSVITFLIIAANNQPNSLHPWLKFTRLPRSSQWWQAKNAHFVSKIQNYIALLARIHLWFNHSFVQNIFTYFLLMRIINGLPALS